jgi:hypothetical protein
LSRIGNFGLISVSIILFLQKWTQFYFVQVGVLINKDAGSSPILKQMTDKGEIKIVGAYYNLKTGEVIFL